MHIGFRPAQPLAVDRKAFAAEVTRLIEAHPSVTMVRELVDVPPDLPTIISTGPVTPSKLAESIAAETSSEAAAVAANFGDAIRDAVLRPFFLPPTAVTVTVLRLRAYREAWVAASVLAATICAILLGYLQITSGRSSDSYLYEITNLGSAVGFFANRNHMGTLLLMAMPFTLALIATGDDIRPQERVSGAAF